MQIPVTRTKKGFPAVWECGGGMSNTGDAQIVCGPDGSRKRPVYVRSRGPLACEEHALFIVHPGDIIIRADHHRRDFEIGVYLILAIKYDYALVKRIYEFSVGEWDSDPPECLTRAIESAKEKATCYHCREPHYLAVEETATA